MKILIINGSPKGNAGNTAIFIKKFNEGTQGYCDVMNITSNELTMIIKDYDTIIMMMPLYVHAMPGIVMRFLEKVEVNQRENAKMGFLIQSGFIENKQSDYLVRILKSQTRRLNYQYLGCVVRGGSAGVYMMPEKMNKKLFNELSCLGETFMKSGLLDEKLIQATYELSKGKAQFYEFLHKISIGDMHWNQQLKANQAYAKRYMQPYQE